MREDRWATRGRRNLLLGVPLALSSRGGGGTVGGAVGSGRPWLSWGKPAICWARGDPSLGKCHLQENGDQRGVDCRGSGRVVTPTDLTLGPQEMGHHSAESARWTSAPFVHAQAAEGHTCPGSRRLRTSAWWTQQRLLSACPTAQCALSPQVGLVERETSPGCPASFWPCPSLPAVWKLKELSFATTIRETSETGDPHLSCWSYPEGDSLGACLSMLFQKGGP